MPAENLLVSVCVLWITDHLLNVTGRDGSSRCADEIVQGWLVHSFARSFVRSPGVAVTRVGSSLLVGWTIGFASSAAGTGEWG